MKKIKYYTGIVIINRSNERKEWYFQPPNKPRLKNNELIELIVSVRGIILTGLAYFIKKENIFYGTGALEQIE